MGKPRPGTPDHSTAATRPPCREGVITTDQATPQDQETQLQTLARIGDRILQRIERGHCTTAERSQLLRQYDQVDRILTRHSTTTGPEADYTLLDQAADQIRAELEGQTRPDA